MKSLSVRGLISGCALTAACVAAATAPSAASAAQAQCEGSNIHGKGSSAQKILQIEIWNKQFNESGNALACNGTQGSKGEPKVSYTSTGSGPGLESWGVETQKFHEEGTTKVGGEIRFGKENAFIGTEIAPNKKQEEEIEAHTTGTGKVLTIPVAQPAIAIVLHLPTGCTGVTGGGDPGRIQIKVSTLEKVFQGTDATWNKILNKAKFTEATKKSCNKDAPIERVVREDGSGTTDAFKKYLGVINKGKPVYEDGETWDEEGEKTDNTVWPNQGSDPVLKGNGGGGLVKKVAETPGSIGYANLADARANTAFGTPTATTFWAEVEDSKGHYADPSTDGEVSTKANSNCAETVYTNGSKKFPPPAATELWNAVSIAPTQVNYEPCYLTYDLALTHYNGYSKGTELEESPFSEAPTESEATTVKNYLNYELSTGAEGAQPAAERSDYLGDPTSAKAEDNVLDIAREGVAKIEF